MAFIRTVNTSSLYQNCQYFLSLSSLTSSNNLSLCILWPELGTLEWWISGLMLDPLFFLISRLNIACFPRECNRQINLQIGIKEITF